MIATFVEETGSFDPKDRTHVIEVQYDSVDYDEKDRHKIFSYNKGQRFILTDARPRTRIKKKRIIIEKARELWVRLVNKGWDEVVH